MTGDECERPEGSGKEPMDPDASFMQVISNLVISLQAMTESLAQMVDRLTTGSIPGTNTPHATQGNSEASNRPHSPTRTYTSSSRIPRPLFTSFQRAPPETIQQPVYRGKPHKQRIPLSTRESMQRWDRSSIRT
jgi:hypothetical protein